MNITESFLRRNYDKDQSKQTIHSIGNGLHIRISPKGKIAFYFRYTFNSKQKIHGLGKFPAMSLNDARLSACQLNEQVTKGINIKNHDNHNVHLATVEEIYIDWHDTIFSVDRKVAEVETKRRQFFKHVPLFIREMPAEELDAKTFESMIFSIKENSVSAAIELINRMTNAFNRAVRNNDLNRNMPGLFKSRDFKLEQGAPKDRHFKEAEFIEFFAKINHEDFNPCKAAHMKLILLTGCRKDELRKSRYTDFRQIVEGIECWEVIKENHKNGKRFNASIFRPMTETMRKQLAIIEKRYPTEFYMGDIEYNKERYYNFDTRFASDVRMKTHFDLKSLRHTFVTQASSMIDDKARKRCSGHSLDGMERHYQHSLFLKEMKVGLENWAQFLINLGMNGVPKKFLTITK